METKTVKKVDEATFANVQLTINKIENYVKENGYQFKDHKGLSEINEENFRNAFLLPHNFTQKKMKKLVNAMSAISKNPTLGNINKFFHFLMKNMLKSETRIKVIKSDKEIAIETKRKAYKEALAKVKQAYADYKTEKGDFYKIKLSKDQKI